ncbi:MAG: DUF2264 domain-containing protein [Cellulomonas sp.]
MNEHSAAPLRADTAGRHASTADWSRAQWTGFADHLLASVLPYASPRHGRITLPGAEGGYGRAVDGLEGFCRTFLLAGFRIAGERGEGMDELAELYARGIAAGVDPDAPEEERWVRTTEHGQAKVEAASIALILDMTRPWIWDRLSDRTQQQVVEYLSPVVGDRTYPKTNWLWFSVVVETFLRSVGGPWSPDDIAADLALHDELYRAGGWYSDGTERSFDNYNGWAMQLYPVLWARMAGATELAAGRTVTDVARLDRYLQDAVGLVGADGAPLFQGRSLIYRFAAAAPFWVGAIAEVPSLSPGALRHAADKVVRHFVDHGAPDERGLLTMGWHHEWRQLAQSYSGPSSPYWASKGMLGISLPADRPVWAAPSEPLPAETGDRLFAVKPAGWVVSGTSADGIVRIANHGTDHAREGSLVGDSPLYARIGYSTATAPLLDEEGWVAPLEQAVVLVDAAGRPTHRAAMTLLDVRVAGDVGVAGSRWTAHWLTPAPTATQHGSGRSGDVVPAGSVTAFSLVRGSWELRLARVDELAEGVDAGTLTLRLGGWPLVGRDTVPAAAEAVSLTSAGVTSTLVPVVGEARSAVVTRADASPLGDPAHVPTLSYPVRVGAWVAALVGLSGVGSTQEERCRTELLERDGGLDVVVHWPDGVRTSSHLSVGASGDAV